MTNKEFARSDTNFINACEATGTKPTPRQASKYRNQRGLAYGAHRSLERQAINYLHARKGGDHDVG